MIKLTKEQADWVINKFINYYEDDSEYGDIHIKRRHFDDILKEIYRNTEDNLNE